MRSSRFQVALNGIAATGRDTHFVSVSLRHREGAGVLVRSEAKG